MNQTPIIRRGKVSDRGQESRTERNRKRKAAEKAAREALERLFSEGEGVGHEAR